MLTRILMTTLSLYLLTNYLNAMTEADAINSVLAHVLNEDSFLERMVDGPVREKKKQLKRAKRLLMSGADVNSEASDAFGMARGTQLQRAIISGTHATTWLIRHGADVNKVTNNNSMPPLFLAIDSIHYYIKGHSQDDYSHSFKLVRKLLLAGADCTKNYEEKMPLYYLSNKNLTSIIIYKFVDLLLTTEPKSLERHRTSQYNYLLLLPYDALKIFIEFLK